MGIALHICLTFSCITPSSHVQPTLGSCPGLNGLCNLVSLADNEEATAKAAHAAETAAALAELPGVFKIQNSQRS